MPLFLDVHENLRGATAADVAAAHEKDAEIQGRYDVTYLRYWVDESDGKVFCLVEAPDADRAAAVHQEAHGLLADRIHLVTGGS